MRPMPDVSLMIRRARAYCESSVNLLQQNNSHKLVRIRHPPKAYAPVGGLAYSVVYAATSAYYKPNRTLSRTERLLQNFGEFFARNKFAAHVGKNTVFSARNVFCIKSLSRRTSSACATSSTSFTVSLQYLFKRLAYSATASAKYLSFSFPTQVTQTDFILYYIPEYKREQSC